MSITGTIEKDTIRLPDGINLPDGTKVEVNRPMNSSVGEEQGNALSWMLKYAGTIDGPEDFAAEHDHYIHGTSKQAGQ